MALWGSNDSIASVGVVTLTYSTREVQGTEFDSQFGETDGPKVGDIIRIGERDSGLGTYFGDAVIVSIASSTRLTIGSTSNLARNGASIAGTSYYISELPISSTGDVRFSEDTNTGSFHDTIVYGVGTTAMTSGDALNSGITSTYRPPHAGWVGVQTYTDMHGNLRVKTEVLVARSGINTGADGIAYPTPEN